jgi:hypothetical protein
MSTVNYEKSTTTEGAAVNNSHCSSKTFEGTLVSVIGKKLVMTNKQGQEYSHTLADAAAISCDGAVCSADDLKAGRRIRVTTKYDDRNVATCIESLDKSAEFGPCGN